MGTKIQERKFQKSKNKNFKNLGTKITKIPGTKKPVSLEQTMTIEGTKRRSRNKSRSAEQNYE
jgi:hypothetical protein